MALNAEATETQGAAGLGTHEQELTADSSHQHSPSASQLRNSHLEHRKDERHYHSSAGIFLVDREHKMPELAKTITDLITSFYLSF